MVGHARVAFHSQRARTRFCSTPQQPGCRLRSRPRFGWRRTRRLRVAGSAATSSRSGGCSSRRSPTRSGTGTRRPLMLALLVAGTAVAGALAAIVKLYAAPAPRFPPRRLVIALLVLAVTLPFLPWQLYVDGWLRRRIPARRRHGTAARGASHCCCRRRSSRSGCFGAAAENGSAFRPCSRQPSSTTCQPCFLQLPADLFSRRSSQPRSLSSCPSSSCSSRSARSWQQTGGRASCGAPNHLWPNRNRARQPHRGGSSPSDPRRDTGGSQLCRGGGHPG